MNISNNYKNKFGISTYIILISIALISAVIAVYNIKLSPDSMTYALVSQEILSGNGISVPLIWFNGQAVPTNGTVPMLMYPPLLPALFALLGGVSAKSYLAAQIINIFCHVATSIFTCLLMKKIYNNDTAALLSGVLVSISYPLLWATHHMLSEPLFIALTVSAMYFLAASRDTGNVHFSRNLFVASVLASAAVLTRHAGIALVPVFLWIGLVAMKNRSGRPKYITIILASALPVFSLSMLFVRNYFISGLIRRWSQPPIERPYIDAFTGTIKMLFDQFQLGRASLALVLILIVPFCIYFIISSDLRRALSIHLKSGGDSVIVFMISYIALFTYALAEKQPRFEIRFMYPMIPFIYLIFIVVIASIADSLKIKGYARSSIIGLILALGLLAAFVSYKTFLNRNEFFYKQEKLYAIMDSCAYKWLTENYGKDTIITTNRPFHISFFGGYSTVILPHRMWAPKTLIPDEMSSVLPERMSQIGSRVLVLIDEADERYFGSYIAELFSERKDKGRFVLAFKCSNGVIYNLQE